MHAWFIFMIFALTMHERIQNFTIYRKGFLMRKEVSVTSVYGGIDIRNYIITILILIL